MPGGRMHVVKQKFLLPLTLAAVLVWSSAAAAANATMPDAGTAGGYNLEQAVLKALQDNPSIRAAKAGDLAAEESRKAARGGFGPR